MSPGWRAALVGAVVAGIAWLALAIHLHFHDDAPPDMSAFAAPPVPEVDPAVRAEWTAKSNHLRPTGYIPFFTHLQNADANRERLRKGLANWSSWLAEWERIAETTPRFHEFAGESPHEWDPQYASRLMRTRAALRLLEGTEDEAYEALAQLYRELRRQIETPQSSELMGKRGLWELGWGEELLLEAALRAKSPMAAERILALYLPSEDELIRRFEAAAPFDRHELKLKLEKAMKTPPPAFPSDIPTGREDWKKVGEALSGRWEKANLLPNATLREVLRHQETSPGERLAQASPGRGDGPSPTVRNQAGLRLIAQGEGAQQWHLILRRLHEIRRAAVRHTWRSGGAAPAALADLGLPAATLTNPCTGKPFRYDPVTRELFLDVDDKGTFSPHWVLPVRTPAP